MGKKYTTFLTLFTVICITLTGCERENEQTANQGRLNLKLAVDTNVENMVTRATADEETLPDINDFSIAVLQNNNVQLTWNRYVNPEKPDVPLNKNDAFQKVQKRRVQEKR